MMQQDPELELLKYMYSCRLLSPDDSLIVTGSFAICCLMKGDFSRFSNGESDIDVFVILNGLNGIKDLLDKKAIDFLATGKINLINYSHTYGIGRNKINIKYLFKSELHKLTNFMRIQYTSCRKTPLTVYKKNEEFMCVDGTVDIYQYDEKYDMSSNWYFLNYSYEPILNNRYRFTNIHSMLINGVLVSDGCNIKNSIDKFWLDFSHVFFSLALEQKLCLFKRFEKSMRWCETELIKYIDLINEKCYNMMRGGHS